MPPYSRDREASLRPDVRVYKSTPQGELHVHVFSPAGGVARCGIVFFMCSGWSGFNAEKHYPQSE
jgi:hypothetical protein